MIQNGIASWLARLLAAPRLLRGLDAEAGDFGEALDGLMMGREDIGHLLIEVAEMRLQAHRLAERRRFQSRVRAAD